MTNFYFFSNTMYVGKTIKEGKIWLRTTRKEKMKRQQILATKAKNNSKKIKKNKKDKNNKDNKRFSFK